MNVVRFHRKWPRSLTNLELIDEFGENLNEHRVALENLEILEREIRRRYAAQTMSDDDWKE